MDLGEDDWHEFDLASFNLSILSRINKSNSACSPPIAKPGSPCARQDRLYDSRNITDQRRLAQFSSKSPTERQKRPEDVDAQMKCLSGTKLESSKRLNSPTKPMEISSAPLADEQADVSEFFPLPSHGFPNVARSAQRLQPRTQQGLQPRRHMQTPSRLEAVSKWQVSQALPLGDDFEGLELPADRLRLTQNDLVGKSMPAFESDNEDWGEGSLGIRHASKMPRSTRASTTSSIISASNATTDQSQDGLDGIELPDEILDLRKRFLVSTERRAAGDTVKQSSRGNAIENPSDGLIVNHDSFRKAPRTVKDSSFSRARHSNTAHKMLDTTKFEVISSGTATKSDVQPRIRLSKSSTVSTTSHGQLEHVPRIRCDENLPVLSSQNISRSSRQRQDTNNISSQYVQARQTRAPQFGLAKPAFLPSGAAPDSSHHVSALQKRLDRRVTASEALRSEASRCNAHAHVRAKTYGEGNELDDLDDLPTHSAYGRLPAKGQPTHDSRPSGYTTIPMRTIQKQLNPHEDGMKTRSTMSRTQQRIDGSGNRKKNRKHATLPGLISAINTTPTTRKEKNMVYNPKTFKWEGNDQVLRHFDEVLKSPPRPALISNVGMSQPVVQVVNGMVFNPEQMSWIRLTDDESELDPFEHLDDLEHSSAASQALPSGSLQSSRVNLEHFSVGEEFDVGRQFIKKQRDEEVKWRTQTRGWFIGRGNSADRTYLQDIYALLTEDD